MATIPSKKAGDASPMRRAHPFNPLTPLWPVERVPWSPLHSGQRFNPLGRARRREPVPAVEVVEVTDGEGRVRTMLVSRTP